MPIQRIHQASFVRGELDPKIVSRVDVVAYEQGLKKARNVLTLNQGGALIVKGGEEILYSHFDKGTGAHMSIDKMIEVVKENSTTIKTANSGTTLFSRFFSS